MIRHAVIVSVVLGCSMAAHAELKRNPFKAPESLVERTQEARGNGAWQGLDLRATLVGRRRSSANVGGVIVTVGEEVGGYRLIAVKEGEALFRKGDESIRVFVHRQAEDGDEE